MGLNVHLFDLRTFPPDNWRGDERFDADRRLEDRIFVEWLNDGKAVFKLMGGRPDELVSSRQLDELDSFRQLIGASADEDLGQFLENARGYETRNRFPGMIFERPKDFAAARVWVHDYKHPNFGDAWNKQRLLNLLDLMEADDNLWLWESW